MVEAFITIRFLDVLDILLVAFFLYQVYMLLKGTVAINIFVGIALVYLLWLFVTFLHMQLLSSILGKFIGVGVILMIIVFQQEIRRFLLLIGTRYKFNTKLALERFFSPDMKAETGIVAPIVEVARRMSKTKTGALIVIERNTPLRSYSQTGDEVNSMVSASLMESIFFPNSPLHDGAVIIVGSRIKAARCILPVSDNADIDANLGLRHRAAIGLTEASDALVVVVSEETGKVSISERGELMENISPDNLGTIITAKMS